MSRQPRRTALELLGPPQKKVLGKRKCTKKKPELAKELPVSSGFYGVSRHGKGWQARITIGGKLRCLGTYETPEAAAAVYNRAAEACEEEKPLNKGRGKTQSTASVVRQKVMAFWTEKWD